MHRLSDNDFGLALFSSVGPPVRRQQDPSAAYGDGKVRRTSVVSMSSYASKALVFN